VTNVDPDFEAIVRAAFQAFNERRFADFASYMTDDVVETYPQSGERLVGSDAQRAMHEAFPHPPTFEIVRVRRSGDLAVVEAREAAGDGSMWTDVWVLELRDGRVAALTGYFGEPFEAPAWRRPHMAQIEA
jgi:ketosteroid isomerase-like protein